MVKKMFLVLICFISLIILISKLHGQESKKTITLPNGEVVWDLNGEWDAFVERYGSGSQYGSYPQLVKITQTGSSFVGIRMIEDPMNPKGKALVRGELDKSGFKKVQITSLLWERDSKGEISKDGNKMIIDNGVDSRVTLTRR